MTLCAGDTDLGSCFPADVPYKDRFFPTGGGFACTPCILRFRPRSDGRGAHSLSKRLGHDGQVEDSLSESQLLLAPAVPVASASIFTP